MWDWFFVLVCFCVVFFFKQKTAYEMRISDWSSDVCSSDLAALVGMGLPISRRLALAALRLVVGGGVARHQRRGAAVLAAAPVAAAARQGGARGQSQDQRGGREAAHEHTPTCGAARVGL